MEWEVLVEPPLIHWRMWRVRLRPPFLIVRQGQSFWVEAHAPEHCSATLQAFRDGCYSGAWCYDATGGEWPIINATLKERPTLLQRSFPWKRVAVELHLGLRVEADLAAAISRIAEVLRSDNEFCQGLRTPPAEVLRQFESARTTADLIQIARRWQRAG